MLSVREWCASVAGARSVRAYRGHTQDMFDVAPFSNSKAFSATSQSTFYGRQAMISVEVLDTTCCAPACGVGELLPTQLAIGVDNRDLEVASSAIRQQQLLNLDLDLCFP